MSNEVALYRLDDMQVMANAIAKSGLFGMKTPEQALALMLVAQAEGSHPATITQDYDIIQGKACRKTHSVMARFQQMGGSVQWHELTDTTADATFSHQKGGSLRIIWTFEQARKAGLTNKDNWKNYPRAMLRARVIAEGVRAVFPAAIGGMLIAEEANDLPPQEVKEMGTIDRETGEARPPEQKALPAYTAELMEADLKKVIPAINAGKITVAQAVATIKSKYTLTLEMEAEFCKRAMPKAETPPVIDGEFAKEYEAAEVAQREPGEKG